METKPCVGCGFCCLQAKCVAGQRLYKSSDICNALVWREDKNRYVCDLMALPGILGEEYRKELYAGAGCCSNLNSWRSNVIKRTEDNKQLKINNIDPLFQMFLRAMGREMMGGDKIILILYGMESELKKKNFPDDEILQLKKLILHHIKSNRNTMFDSFMGGLPKETS